MYKQEDNLPHSRVVHSSAPSSGIRPFSYFIANKQEIINDLESRLIELKGQRFICSDKDLPYIQHQIDIIQRSIKFNMEL